MSLINKMLQDLDARGSHSGAALPSDLKPVMIAERRLPVMQIAVGVAVLLSAMVVAGYFWIKARAPVPAAVVLAAPAKLVVMPAAPTIKIVAAAPPAPVVAVAPAAPAAVAAPVAQAAPAPAASVVSAPPAPPAAPARQIASAAPALRNTGNSTPVAPPPDAFAAAVDPSVPRAAPVLKQSRQVVRVVESDRIVEAAVSAVRASTQPAPMSAGRDMNNSQKAESQYRQATAALDEGRVASAMDGMEQALRLNPRHDAARQSLVALLIEAGRNDEAMQQLEQGLTVDAGQTSLAMLLARMQIERGASGVATLQRSLPTAQGNGEYHAFLAGALQREGRHREAIEQYGAALRSSQEHGVWLMGLGISLQAEKRNAEALTAFQKSKASGMLTPQLLTFVERKIQGFGQ